MGNNNNFKSLDSLILEAACPIRAVQNALKHKHFNLPLISSECFTNVLFAGDESDIPFILRK